MSFTEPLVSPAIKRRQWIPVLTAFTVAFCAHSLSAATFYVATNGSDSNSGSSASPLKTIQKGVSLAGPGDTVIVRDGTYGRAGCTSDSSFAVNINKAGTASAYITIKAENKHKAVLDAEQVCHSYFNLGSGSAYISIEDLVVRRGNWGGIWANSNAHDIALRGNKIENIGDWRSTTSSNGIAGFYTGESTRSIIVDGNVIHDVGRIGGVNHDHGLYLHGANYTITNNIFYNNTKGWHIQTSSGLTNVLIANNTFAFPNPNRGGHIVFDGDNSGVTIRNNIFYKTTSVAVTNAGGTSANCVIDNNIILGATSATNAGCSSSNNRFVDPKLVNTNTAPYDFKLQSSSPAINSAATIASITEDHDGNSRPQGGAYEAGAYEYVASSSNAPVITAVAASGVQSNAATITWTTDVASDSSVQYGTSTNYTNATPTNSALVTNHGVALANLSPGTLYYYRVISKSSAGVSSASSNYTFSTPAAAQPAPAFSFSLSAAPSSVSVARGQSGASVVSARLVSGSAQGVSFAVSALPAGVTGRLSAASCTVTCSSTLTLSASTAAALGTYQIGVVASGGGASASSAISLAVIDAGTPVGGSTPVTGLVGWWKFDEGRGTTASDASGNANTGTFRGTAAWATGAWGTAASLTGSNYIAVGERASLKTSTAMTVSFWISAQVKQSQRIVAKSSSWDVKLNSQRPQFSAAGKWAAMNYTLPTGTWRHVVFTFSSGVVIGYVDGVQRPLYENTFTSGTVLPAAAYGLNIGADAGQSNLAKGLLDEVRIYNRVLTDSEISTLYSQTRH